jgi:hypothetical protein
MTTYPLHVQREVDRRWAHLVGAAANLVREASAEYVAVRHCADAAALTGTRCTSPATPTWHRLGPTPPPAR